MPEGDGSEEERAIIHFELDFSTLSVRLELNEVQVLQDLPAGGVALNCRPV